MSIWRGINNNPSPLPNSLLNKENNSSHTKTSQTKKDKQIIVDYSNKNNFYLFKYLFFNNQGFLSELLRDKPLLFSHCLRYMDWLILTFGQAKPKHLIKLPSDGHKYYDCSHCKGKGNVKVVHHKHSYPDYFLKGDLSYHLIKRGRAGLKTGNLIHPDADVAKNKEQQLRQPWREKALSQFKKWVKYLDLPLIPSPSGGCQTEYPRHWKQEVKNCNLYFNSKETNHEYLHFGERKAQGGYVVHPLGKDRLGTITMERLLEWLKKEKQQKRRERDQNKKKKFKFYSNQLIEKSASRFGIYFTNQPKLKEDKLTERDNSNDLTDVSLSILGCKQLIEQKTTDYDPYQITYLNEPFEKPKTFILNAQRPHLKKLLVKFLKNDGSFFQFKSLEISKNLRLQRWIPKKKQAEERKEILLPQIPKYTGKVEVKRSAYGQIIKGKNGGYYQPVIYTDAQDNQEYSVLFNCDNSGDSGTTDTPFLDDKVGNFQSSFYLNAGERGSFIRMNPSGGNFNMGTNPANF